MLHAVIKTKKLECLGRCSDDGWADGSCTTSRRSAKHGLVRKRAPQPANNKAVTQSYNEQANLAKHSYAN